MKKQFTAMLVIVTIILSGTAGFGGTYLANSLSDTQTEAPAYTQETVVGMDAEQLQAYLDEYIADYIGDSSATYQNANTASYETSMLSSTSSVAAGNTLTIPEITALTSNSVVEIYTETVASSGRMRQYVTEGAGSGIIITADGYIVTNNHVIDGARKITVRLKNGDEYDAALIGRDSKTDLAVLKIGATGLQPVTYGDSSKLEVGELAVAIGNPLGELGGSVTEGIISALSRSIDIDGETMTLLQTSAAVNPGNSGGGLFNSYGELIGVVNAKSGGSDIEGIGFAIPVNTVKTVVDSLMQYGYVPGRINFGADLIDINDSFTAMAYRVQTGGVYVSRADSDSGLQSGDRIVSINGTEINSSAEVKSYLDDCKVDDILSIVVSRSGKTTAVELKLKQAKL